MAGKQGNLGEGGGNRWLGAREREGRRDADGDAQISGGWENGMGTDGKTGSKWKGRPGSTMGEAKWEMHSEGEEGDNLGGRLLRSGREGQWGRKGEGREMMRGWGNCRRSSGVGE